MTNQDTPIEEAKTFERSGLPKEEVLSLLRTRLMQEGQRKLKDEFGMPLRGIKTGLDEAFILDAATREALIAADPQSAELLKPFARAASIDRWSSEIPAEWIIYTVPGAVSIDDYPAIKKHLEKYRDQLEQRAGDRQWFELLHADQGDRQQVVDMKVVFRGQSDWPGFTLERQDTCYCDASFQIPNGDYYLTGLLNSRLYWYLLGSMSSVGSDGVVHLQSEHFGELPYPMPDIDDLSLVGSISDFCHLTVVERNQFHAHMCAEIAKYIAPGGKASELSSTMRRWYVLDAGAMSDEAKRHFGQAIAADQMQMWDEFLQSGKYEWSRINSEIARAERKLDLLVYQMFGLNPEEIEYLDKV